MTDFKPIRLQVSHGPNLHFEGKLIHSYSTQNGAGSKERWTELRLWETPAGNWIAEMVGCSSRGNEGDIREARLIRDGRAARTIGMGIDAVVQQVMEAFNWTTAAKAFAREMRWDVTVRVE